jgi:hypothetical protein
VKCSVKLESAGVSEVHPVVDGMLTDGMNTINSRWLSRAADCVQAMRRTGKCQTLTIEFHPMGCKHGRKVIP